MKILLIHSFNVKDNKPEFNAVSYYRMNKPHEVLARLNPDFEIVHSMPNDIYPDDFLQTIDLVLFCREIDNSNGIIEALNKLGIRFGLDLDDYWILPEDHLLYEHYKETNKPQLIIDSIKAAHFVICTTEILATKIKEHNKEVYVIENGIDTDDTVWQNNHINSKRIRYGFTQGTTHLPDVMSIHKDVQTALYDADFNRNCQVILTGWNAIRSEESVYIGYERMLTDNLKTMLPVEREYCLRLVKYKFPSGISKPYRRVGALPVYEFAKVYDEMDILVSPLIANDFNSCKSELKMMEAGHKGCAVMCHNVNPYSSLMTKHNSFDLTWGNFYEWSKYILSNPNIVKDTAAQLTLDTKRFSLNLLTDKRKQLYERFK